MAGRKPDYIVKFPVRETKGNGQTQEVKEVWHRLGAAWVHENQSGTIGVTLDVGVPIMLPPGAQLVLVPPPQDGAEGAE